ncbi:hypothetical protein HZS_2655 [Henneguya salminicola]|nr:hypothetical protein HZS_2655 [Henneguya salminicola]
MSCCTNAIEGTWNGIKTRIPQEIEHHRTENMESRIRMKLTAVSQSFSGGEKIAPTYGMALLML